MTRHFDYLAIGGGSGGIASINRAAMYGQKCALIEAKELGGTTIIGAIFASFRPTALHSTPNFYATGWILQ
ncbi:hypothetical protein F3I50_07190 [Pantoea sp. M_5]|nr:hypothetical protein F3I50_07190 [Pantoea sp. M_5]